ncbi:MAG TPA: ABC transporter substrate-binding protein [Longimicrobium sp.]|jgi:peptide/nickel transport system substrate-binding protein|nr:ABC transporter substrate-binding protein [Longimicrobium sp.]
MKLRTPILPVLLLLALGACTADTHSAPATAVVPDSARYGGTLVIGAASDIGDIDPLTWNVQNALYMQESVLFTPLIAYDSTLKPVPRLARSWEVNADTTLLTFHLRDDVWWQDGVRTSAHDVKFTYDLLRNPKTGYIYSGLWTFYGEAEAPDSFTFRIHLKPHAEFLDVWRTLAPVPEHVLRGVPPERLAGHPFGTRRPVGNGPFRFVSRRAGQEWVFAANPRWPKELGGRPYADRLVYRVVPEPATLLTELETGAIDLYPGMPPQFAPRVRESTRARLVDYPDLSYEHIIWNTRRRPFDDARVRRAMTLAIDRAGLVRAVRSGYARVANSTVSPELWMHDPAAGAGLGYDTAAARRLLAEAGFADRDGDGVLEAADGRPLRFTLKVPHGNRERGDIAEIVQSDLRKAGVAMELREVEFNTLIAQISDPRKRDFDAVIVGWKPEFHLDDSDLYACSKRDQPLTWSGYCDPEADRLMDSVQIVADRAAALPLWRRYQALIARDQPVTLLYFSNRLVGVNRRVHDVHLDARGDWVGIDRWWITPGMR